MQAKGGMMAFELWERAMVPFTVWVGITSTEEERLYKIQEFFWRVMLKVPESCPRIALRAENGMMGIKTSDLATQIIIIEENQRTAKKILEEQWSNQWP